ncbi:MAG: acyl-CoA dehydrogenase family protein, partial [Advenella sp.]
MDDHHTDSATGHRRPLSATRPDQIRNDQQAIQAALILAQDYAASAAQRDRERILPWQEIEAFTASGLGGITVPAHFGGADVSYLTLAKVFTIISEADPSLGQIPQNHFAVLQLLRETGTPQQQARWFADVLNGHRIGNAGPERKARAGLITQPTTHIVRTAEGLRLNGTRFYSTGALFAHWIPLRALHESGNAVQVWVRRDAPGVTIVDDWDAFGQRTTVSGSVILENVPIDEADIVDMTAVPTLPNLAGPVS